MKKIQILLIAITLVVVTNTYAQKEEKVHHVVMQLNSADTAVWSSTIGNIKNLQKIWPGSVKIEVVVHGKALNFLVASKTHLLEDINLVANKGVVFSACENTMKKYAITKEMLVPIASTVPSGVGELVIKQENGWSYLKTGQ